MLGKANKNKMKTNSRKEYNERQFSIVEWFFESRAEKEGGRESKGEKGEWTTPRKINEKNSCKKEHTRK